MQGQGGYADGVGLRLVTETNDRCVVAIASRDNEAKMVRAVVARSKRHTGSQSDRILPPAKTKVDFEGLPISGKSQVTILRLGPSYGPLREQDLPGFATERRMDVVGGKLTIALDKVEENQVYSITIAPADGGLHCQAAIANPSM
jgi:hypothetical protein